MDTIFALASARGKAGIAVLRISGPQAHDTLRHLAGDLPAARRASLRTLRHEGEVLDQAIVLAFDRGASFTGEDAAELHVHGGPSVTSALLSALSALPGLRLAEAGEFTRRAFEAGRLDLVQVEGLADLIDAETEAQRRQAQRTLSGAVGRRVEAWRRQLIRAAALLAANIDFSDEDIPADTIAEVDSILRSLNAELLREIDGAKAAERVRDGFEVAIIGQPNAGKSSLLNALAGRDAAITSEVAGTTRDVIEVRMEMTGLAVTLLDTAGLRVSDDSVEQIGMQRAIARAAAADLRIFLDDGSGLPADVVPAADDIVLNSKIDIARVVANGRLGVSAHTGEGIAALLDKIGDQLAPRVAGAAMIVRERQRAAIASASTALFAAQGELGSASPQIEICAEHIRTSTRALDMLVGRIDVEDMLGEIFASFCIGK